MITERKAYTTFEVKETDDEARTFTGLASTWDQDLGGDIIIRGAFRDTLSEWQANGKVIPLLDSHRNDSLLSVVGKMTDAKETKEGLEATFEVMEGPTGDEVYRRIKGGYVDGLSIGYETLAWEKPDDEERQKGAWRKLTKINLMEVSVVLWPMNTGARIESVKAALDGAEPEYLTDTDRKELRALAGRIGALLRPPDEKSADPEDDAEPTSAEEQDPTPTPEPSADSEGDDVAPAHLKEALLERIGRIKGTPTEGEPDDE